MSERLYVISIALTLIMGMFIMRTSGLIELPEVITLAPLQIIGGAFLVFVMFFVGRFLI